jgi:hypothetical protein
LTCILITEAVMPIATAMAGVTLRLEPGAFREVSMRFFH